jgi:hypothetical protein
MFKLQREGTEEWYFRCGIGSRRMCKSAEGSNAFPNINTSHGGPNTLLQRNTIKRLNNSMDFSGE